MYEALGPYFDLIYPHDEFARAFSGGIQEIRRRLRKRSGLRIIDLCCGTGRTASAFGKVSGEVLCGVDNNEYVLAKARKNLPHALFVNKDVLTLRQKDLPIGEFDLVLMGGSSIQHFSHLQRKRIMKLAHTLLRPGGLFVFDIQKQQGSTAVVRRVFMAHGRLVLVLLFRELRANYIQQHNFVIKWPGNRNMPADVEVDEFRLFPLSRSESIDEGVQYDLGNCGLLKTKYKLTEFICLQKQPLQRTYPSRRREP